MPAQRVSPRAGRRAMSRTRSVSSSGARVPHDIPGGTSGAGARLLDWWFPRPDRRTAERVGHVGAEDTSRT